MVSFVCSIILILYCFILVFYILYGKGFLVVNGIDLCMVDIWVIMGYESDVWCFFFWKYNIIYLVVDVN